MDSTTSICVAVPTFRRPERLAGLLHALAAQEVPDRCTVTVIVFDNDDVPSAWATVLGEQVLFPFPLKYQHVSEPGLCVVRNAAIEFAKTSFDFLAMIDDDEIPSPRWLAELVRIERQTGSDAVVGPVVQVLPAHAPRWIRDGNFYDLPVYEDAARLQDGYSGNCLLNVRTLGRFDLLFDPALNAAGGEDLLFFRLLRKRGGRTAFAALAAVEEPVPPDRLRAAYLIRLCYRRGNTLAICDRLLDGSPATMTTRALKAAARVTLGVMQFFPLGVLRGRTGLMISLCNIALGCGAAAGLGGHIYHAYRRVETVHA